MDLKSLRNLVGGNKVALPPLETMPLASATMLEEIAKPDVSVIRIVEMLIVEAYGLRASDIHLDPRHDGILARFRIDGVLQDSYLFPKKIQNEIISRLKILSGLRTDEHQAAQDGRFRITTEVGSIDVRVSIVPTYYGENSVMRLLSENAEEFTLESLNFTPENEEKILRAIKKPYGMVLATGPTGSGKTTTLYTIVKMLHKPGISIITLEDPIEYSIPGINQIQVNSRTNLTFENGLRSLLRQDPNIIMVGEIRDVETAGLAVNTALTGHLVLSTLHTNDAPTTLPRLLDMKVEPYLIASTVNVAIGQRLVRRICKHCKDFREMTKGEEKSLAEVLPKELLASHAKVHFGRGCEKCLKSGYLGRAGIQEVMEIESVVREAILGKASASEIRRVAISQGMTPILEDGLRKAAKGITTIEEVLRMRYE